MTTLQVYCAMYSTEITVFVALLAGLSLGMWMGYELGKEHYQPRRDNRGRFIK